MVFCIVKDDNPGTDLLIAADWAAGLGETWIEPEELPQLTGLSGFAAPDTETDRQVPKFFSIDEPPLKAQILPDTPVPEKTADQGKYFFLLMVSLFVSIVILSWTLFRKRDK